jgi:hypothetical protein
MMRRWVCVVEGHGEALAMPILLRRIAAWLFPQEHVDVVTPIRVQKDRFLQRPDEFNKFLLLARSKAGQDGVGESGHVLVLLDADDDCPKERAAAILQSARLVVSDRKLSVVLANREFEAWFIASAASLNGVRGLTVRPGDEAADPEAPRNAKGWMAIRMPTGYGETTDQPAFAARMDLDMARARSRSFRKLCKELAEL